MSKNKLKQSLTVYLDSSVVLSGLASPDGGSGKILKAGVMKKLKLVTNPSVIQEVAQHLSKLKITPESLTELLKTKTVLLKPNPKDIIQKKFLRVVTDPNDIHVVAGASLSGANFFVSLDKKHILTPLIKATLSPMQVISPKEFWRNLKRLN